MSEVNLFKSKGVGCVVKFRSGGVARIFKIRLFSRNNPKAYYIAFAENTEHVLFRADGSYCPSSLPHPFDIVEVTV